MLEPVLRPLRIQYCSADHLVLGYGSQHMAFPWVNTFRILAAILVPFAICSARADCVILQECGPTRCYTSFTSFYAAMCHGNNILKLVGLWKRSLGMRSTKFCAHHENVSAVIPMCSSERPIPCADARKGSVV